MKNERKNKCYGEDLRKVYYAKNVEELFRMGKELVDEYGERDKTHEAILINIEKLSNDFREQKQQILKWLDMTSKSGVLYNLTQWLIASMPPEELDYYVSLILEIFRDEASAEALLEQHMPQISDYDYLLEMAINLVFDFPEIAKKIFYYLEDKGLDFKDLIFISELISIWENHKPFEDFMKKAEQKAVSVKDLEKLSWIYGEMGYKSKSRQLWEQAHPESIGEIDWGDW